ncbi:MAG: 50S ribosomal protein L19 [Alphaproteobacteria bacterium]|nr:50S ribosomal protein L19 [Alphaproteobacteria bacterium]
MNILQKFEASQTEKALAQKKIPEFSAGDTIKVNVRIKEGSRERVQAFEGVCIARSGSGMTASFTVRKISLGEGVERVFPLLSPRIENIELVRRGSVRRAKLYYLRDRRGKSARIAERISGHGIEAIDPAEKAKVSKTQKVADKKAAKKLKREEARKEQEKIKAEKLAAKEAEKKAKEAEAAAAEAPEAAPAEEKAENTEG